MSKGIEPDAEFPFTPRAYGGPPEAYALRRSGCPLAPVVLPSGDEVLLATTYEDVRDVHADTRFSRNLRYPGAPRMFAGRDIPDDPHALVNMDPPEHTRLRRIVQSAFTPRRAEEWRPRIHEQADRLLDAIAAGSPPIDLLDSYALPLPIHIICRLLGVPDEDSPRFRTWSDVFLSTSTATADERSRAGAEFASYTDGLIADRRRKPRADLLDELINAHDAEDRLSKGELARMVRGLIIAGHETTGHVIGRGVLALLRHPDQLAQLRQEPELLRGAVEEILRTEVPGHGGLLRVATEDLSLPSGGIVPKGRAVLAPVVAANYDPRQFADPDEFDIRRSTESRHLAFGHGPHFCLGANLARVELEVAIGSLVERLPDLALAVPPQGLEWTTGSRICSLVELPVAW
ncbi:cytochrome P450 [Streptomyces sp. AN091965]|uniref:cytochrome P450 n=1 Tax=Streptomyces sp. AN091965 TaxID=2927803 RepID=UPI001F620EBC|nr:cytochrome P450 [Streptomyces sp. AN091965]MCI3928835.1 cytochrome P450 [Streptomyces sp. AN091965]